MHCSRRAILVALAFATGLLVLPSCGPGLAAEPDKLVVAGTPTPIPYEDPIWKDRGRIFGRMANSPGCTVEALDQAGKVVKSLTLEPDDQTYRLQWLTPGTYSLRVTADGYGTALVNDLVVQAKHDLHVNLGFGTDPPPPPEPPAASPEPEPKPADVLPPPPPATKPPRRHVEPQAPGQRPKAARHKKKPHAKAQRKRKKARIQAAKPKPKAKAKHKPKQAKRKKKAKKKPAAKAKAHKKPNQPANPQPNRKHGRKDKQNP